MITVPRSEIASRLVAFQRLLGKSGIEAAVIRQNTDLYYFAGTVQDAHLVIPSEGQPVFLVRRDLHRAEEQSPIRPIVPLTSMKQLPAAVEELCGESSCGRLGMELDVLPANTFFFYERLFPGIQIVDVGSLIRQVRSIKSSWELEMMRESAKLSRAVFDAVPQFLREGATEIELSASLEMVARKAGHLGITRMRAFNMEIFFGHILSGPEAAVSSYSDSPTGGVGMSPAFGQGQSSRPIRRSELVSVDTMMNYNGYLNDQTRNFSIGPPPEKLMEAYRRVVEIHEKFRTRAKPGAVTGEIYQQIVHDVEQAGPEWADAFMGHGESRVNFIGHGLGLEVDEFPFIAKGQKLVLEEGMTLAFEPKFILPGIGIAGLENTYLITANGAESLNTAPEDLVVL